MFKVEAVVNGDQLETLLLAAKAVGVTLSLGVAIADDEPSPRRKGKPKARSTKRSKPKRYKASMQVRVGPEPESPPKLVKIHRRLRKKYGDDTFRKGDIKAALGIQPGYVTKLLDQGNLVAG